MINEGIVGTQANNDGVMARQRLSRTGAAVVTEIHGRYYEQSRRGNLFMAQAIVTAPVIYTTAAGTGGPLLWNGSTNVVANIIAVTWGVTTVTTVAAAIGLTGNTGQTSAPGSTTAIDGRTNLYLGGAASACTPYRVGTPTNAGAFLLSLGSLHTGALTTETGIVGFVDVGGALSVPPACWASVSASATASTTVATFGLIWEENPL